MSILVTDGYYLAADSFANAQGISFPFKKVSERILSDGSKLLGGVVGPLSAASAYLSWFHAGMNPEDYPTMDILGSSAQLLTVSKDKGIIRYNGTSRPIMHGKARLALGEGAPFAYGAMFAGGSLATAVQAAIEYCPDCNGRVQMVSL